MTGYQSKRAAAQDKLAQPEQAEVLAQAVPDETLTIVYQSGYYDGKKAALAGQEQNFCPRCGKRTQDIHTCTPPQRPWVDLTDEEIKILWIQYRAALPRYLCFAKALLARAKEKNT